jgi:L-seryl-tRNA(Ser) seleniumtransferase
VSAPSPSDPYRQLPSVDELLRRPELVEAIAREGHALVADAARSVLARLRQTISASNGAARSIEADLLQVVSAVTLELQHSVAYSLRPVVNATGVILHTNLGRAPLAGAAFDHMRTAAEGYSNLEFDLATGERGKRDGHANRLFQKLFGDMASRQVSTLVVNNNAAAVWLALNTLAARGEVIVSRGELVEIGGSFRIPDVMAQSNATLREVGTTNRTRIADYEHAINENTRVLLRVHRSNFQITGFTEQPTLEELVELARRQNLMVIEDLGSGAIFDLRTLGLAEESTVAASLRAGVDVVTYSGDKLLGGPQAGMLSGTTALVQRMRSNSLFRALRVDKLTYAALETTLLAYLKGDYDQIPALRMMRMSKEVIGRRAEAVAERLRGSGIEVELVDGESVIGGGAAPSSTLRTRLLTIAVSGVSADDLQARLRSGETPVIARVQDGRVVIDLRTVFAGEEDCIVQGLMKMVGRG